MNTQESPVQVVRYIRPWGVTGYLLYSENDGDFLLHDNLHGITVVFGMDYDSRTVVARWSICNGDNFCKEVGYDRALHNPHREYFDLDLVKDKGSLMNALLFTLQIKYPKIHFTGYDYSDYLKLFLRASRGD